jgi:hypothetical protein
MLVSIPVGNSTAKRLSQLLRGFKATPFEGQGTQLLPAGFNQIEPTGILGNELNLYFRPG